MILAALTDKYKQSREDARQQLHQVLLIFKPDTVLGWHRESGASEVELTHRNKGGRPQMARNLKPDSALSARNPRWGYGKIEGELLKLGYEASRTAIRNVLKRHSIVPAPVRSGSIGWRHFDDALQGTDPGLRLLYGGNDLAENPVCALLHRILHTPYPSGWHHDKS